MWGKIETQKKEILQKGKKMGDGWLLGRGMGWQEFRVMGE
jgi:hypothetical protein